jgi:RNA polymerase sigma-70 factor, ECF subfamily
MIPMRKPAIEVPGSRRSSGLGTIGGPVDRNARLAWLNWLRHDGTAMIGDELVAMFCAAAPMRSPRPDFEVHLRDYLERAWLAWPHFQIGAANLISHLAARSPAGVLPPAEHAGDMLLACACLRGLPTAISAFLSTYGGVVRRVVAHRTASAADVADAEQMLYARLLVARRGAEPKLAEYRARGPLRSWLSSAAATTALSLHRASARRRTHERRDPATVGAVAAVIGPELLYFKRLYKRQIERAVERALEGLDDHASALLRLYFGEQLSIDHLGALYRVNRSTAARWIAAARERIAHAVQADLRGRLKLSESDYEGLVALVRSELDITVLTLFKMNSALIAEPILGSNPESLARSSG